MVRILSRYHSKIPFLHAELQNANPKAHVMISLLTMTMFIGQILPAHHLSQYIEKVNINAGSQTHNLSIIP